MFNFYQYSANHNNQTGFSLIEAMITLAIIAILASISVPSFSAVISKNRVSTASNSLLSTLAAARSHAVTQQRVVIVCQLVDNHSEQCSTDRTANADWSQGWLAYADLNRNNQLDNTDEILQISSHADQQTNIVFNQRGRLRFFPLGSARSAGFYLCSKQSETVRHVKLLHTGRARIQSDMGARQRAICAGIRV